MSGPEVEPELGRWVDELAGRARPAWIALAGGVLLLLGAFTLLQILTDAHLSYAWRSRGPELGVYVILGLAAVLFGLGSSMQRVVVYERGVQHRKLFGRRTIRFADVVWVKRIDPTKGPLTPYRNGANSVLVGLVGDRDYSFSGLADLDALASWLNRGHASPDHRVEPR